MSLNAVYEKNDHQERFELIAGYIATHTLLEPVQGMCAWLQSLSFEITLELRGYQGV